MTARSKGKTYFVITYRDPKDQKIIALKAQSIRDSSLGLAFISISDFIFDTQALVVSPEEESMAKHFRDVKTLHLSIYSIISVEEIGAKHKGLTFRKAKSNLVVLRPTDNPPNGKP